MTEFNPLGLLDEAHTGRPTADGEASKRLGWSRASGGGRNVRYVHHLLWSGDNGEKGVFEKILPS